MKLLTQLGFGFCILCLFSGIFFTIELTTHSRHQIIIPCVDAHYNAIVNSSCSVERYDEPYESMKPMWQVSLFFAAIFGVFSTFMYVLED